MLLSDIRNQPTESNFAPKFMMQVLDLFETPVTVTPPPHTGNLKNFKLFQKFPKITGRLLWGNERLLLGNKRLLLGNERLLLGIIGFFGIFGIFFFVAGGFWDSVGREAP